MRKNKLLALAVLVLAFSACKKETNVSSNQPQTSVTATEAVYTGFPETFESGTKTAYAAADVTLSTGSWNLNDALLGNSASDAKNGTKSVRIQNSGIVSMNFNVTNGAASLSVYYAKYGSDANSTFQLWASTDNGTNWAQVGLSLIHI